MMRWLRRPAIVAEPLLNRLVALMDPMAAVVMNDVFGPALVIDAQGSIIRANSALAQLLPQPIRVVGTAFELLLHPTARAAAWDEIAPILAGRSIGKTFASSFDRGDVGQDIHVTALPLQASDQATSGALLRLTDLTMQRQLEEQLAHSQKLQATGQLAGGIAHDFNNLLTAILGAADGIVEREPPGETSCDATQIHSSALRGAALVRQLLAFGRQQTLQPRILAVNAVIEDISDLLRRLLGGQVRLTVSLEQPGRLVRADPTQLDQVLVNLAVNARDAMPQGGELELRSGHITIYRPLVHGAETIPPGRYVMIEVRDTGDGIAADVLPRIFDPFFTTKRERGGSGLGLSTVHGIVRQSDGFLVVESELDRGTSVRIYLPRWDTNETVAIPRPPPITGSPARPPVAAPQAPSVAGAVLLVDDEDAVRDLAERALRRAGWEVLSADCGESALELLESRGANAARLSALVSDMVMPGMDGTAVALAVRQRVGNPDLPVILVSGYAQSPLPRGLDADCMVFLAKPYSLADLVAAVGKTGHSAE